MLVYQAKKMPNEFGLVFPGRDEKNYALQLHVH